MRNQRSNFIPIPTKPAKSAPKPMPRLLVQRRSSSSQTERVVLIKEENINFHPSTRFNQNDGGMRRDYLKAINYINSCHKFVNTIVEKNCSEKNAFVLPLVTNYLPIFSFLIGKKPKSSEKKVEKRPKNEERKSKSSFALKKEEKPPIDSVPVGDCEKPLQPDENYVNKVAEIVREQIQHFLCNIEDDMQRASRKADVSKRQKCKNLGIVKQRLEELSKIYHMKKNPEMVHFASIESEGPEHCSLIHSDTEHEGKEDLNPIRITCYGESATSLGSDSSDIDSDSDIE